MKKIIFIVFILIFGISYSQEKKVSDCNLQVKNKLWKTEFQNTESKSERIILIKEKIKTDSIYSKYKPKIIGHGTPTIANQVVDTLGNQCGCKILFILNYGEKKSLIINLNIKPEYSIILDKLNSENVYQIYSAFDTKAVALYGTNGKCGVVQMSINDRKLIQLIKNTVL